MKAYKVMTILMLVLLAVPFLGMTFANPDVGPGILDDVRVCGGSSVGVDNNGMFIVNPGDSYYVILTNIEDKPRVINVWIAGSHQNGVSWEIQKTATRPEGGTTYTSECFIIPSTAGCTITVHYYEHGIVAASKYPPSEVGHMKNYDDNGIEVPCCGISMPEIPLGPEVLSALGLLAISVITRKRSKK